jgi:hypothetical protein
MRARYQSATGMCYSIGLVLAPVGTTLYATRPSALWLLCVAIGAVGAVMLLTTVRAPAVARS